MEHITAAGNTEIPAYLALLDAGFEVDRRRLENGTEMWMATNLSMSFSGPSALEVLGLYSMRTARGADWKAADDEINEYLSAFYPDALPPDNDAN